MGILENYRKKKVLVTGGGGFIGSNLTQRLVELGSQVSIMDSKLFGHGFNDFNIAHLKDRITLDFSDIRDSEAVKRNIIGQDIIFNLAALVGEKNSLDSPQLNQEINVDAHYKCLELIAKHNPKARIIFPGSRLEYGKTNKSMPISEIHPLNPVTPYAKAKMIGEKMHLDMHKEKDLQTVVMRIANPYGPRASITNPGYCIVNWFIGKSLQGQELPIYGDGAQLRDYIFIEDLVEALLVAGLEKKAVGQVFNVGCGVGIPFNQMAEMIVKLTPKTGSKVKYIEWPKDAKERETGDFIADITKIRDYLDWSPKHSLEEGLKETIKFYSKYKQHYPKK